MKLLFVYESLKIFEDNKGDFYSGWNQEVWDRYLNIFQDMTVMCRKDEKKYDSFFAKKHFEKFDNKRIMYMAIPNLKASIKSYISIEKRRNLYKIIESEVIKSDCVIVRIPNEASLLTIKLAKKHNKPYLVEVVGCAWDSLWNHSTKGKLTALFNYLAMKKAVSNAPYALYVTNKFLQKRYPCHGQTIGISDVTLPPLSDYFLQQRVLKINNKKKNGLIVIGTLAAVNVKYKGQEYVIKAISKLNKEGYNFEYHLAGGGDINHLKSLAERYNVVDKVKFLGSLPYEKVFDYLNEIDLYIQPSKIEGLPRSIVEAMSRACPILGSATGGIPELLNEKSIFTVGSVNEICNLLKSFDNKTMLEQAYCNFEKAKEFNKELLNEKRASFYREFLKFEENI